MQIMVSRNLATQEEVNAVPGDISNLLNNPCIMNEGNQLVAYLYNLSPAQIVQGKLNFVSIR